MEMTLAHQQSQKPLPPMELICLCGNEQGKRFGISGGRQTFGRSHDNDLVLSDATVSGHHGVLVYSEEGQVQFHDTDSRNGISRDGKKSPILTLKPGEEIRIGSVSMRLVRVSRRPAWAVLGVIVALLFLAAGCATVRPAALAHAFESDLEEARKLVTTGHLKQAIDELSLLIEMDPKNSEARFLRGIAYQGLEEFDLAVRDYDGIIARNPDTFKAHYNLGMIYAYKLNEPGRALTHFDRFLSLAPDHDKAFSAAKTMCSLDASRSSEDPAMEGFLEELAGIPDLEERRRRLRESAESYPGSPEPLYRIGKTYEAEGNKEEAIRAYREALEIRPTCAPCHKALGNLLRIVKKGDEAQEHLVKAKLFDPTESDNLSSH